MARFILFVRTVRARHADRVGGLSLDLLFPAAEILPTSPFYAIFLSEIRTFSG
jgi:hypothetical protein